MPQLLSPNTLEPMLPSKRSHCNEKPTHRNSRKPMCSNEDSEQSKINHKKILKVYKKEKHPGRNGVKDIRLKTERIGWWGGAGLE